MEREKRKKYNNNSLFTFDEMLNQKLDRWESCTLNGRHSPSLVYSLVVDMFRYIGDERDGEEILKECNTTENWFNNYTWTTIQCERWRKEHLVPILMKRMKLPKYRAVRESAWFMLQWSFRIVDPEEILKQ